MNNIISNYFLKNKWMLLFEIIMIILWFHRFYLFNKLLDDECNTLSYFEKWWLMFITIILTISMVYTVSNYKDYIYKKGCTIRDATRRFTNILTFNKINKIQPLT